MARSKTSFEPYPQVNYSLHRGYQIMMCQDKTVRAFYYYNTLIVNLIELYDSLQIQRLGKQQNMIKNKTGPRNPKYSAFWNKLQMFLYREIQVPTSLFFLFVLLKQLGLLEAYINSFTLLSVGLLFMLLFSYNHYLLYSSVLNSSIGVLGFFNILIGILGLNQRWKLYLFWFCTTYYGIVDENSKNLSEVFSLSLSLAICWESYRNLIFKTVNDNIEYFSGFFAYMWLKIFNLVLKYIKNEDILIIQKISVLPGLLFLGYAIINMRIQKLQSDEPESIKNPHVLIHYIKLIQEQLQKKDAIVSYLHCHQKYCKAVSCFCHSQSTQRIESLKLGQNDEAKKYFENTIINNLFIAAIQSQNWEQQDQFLIRYSFIQFLISAQQYLIAIQMLCELQNFSNNYFNRCLSHRVKSRLEVCMANQKYFDYMYEKKLNALQTYDIEVSFVVKEIREILFLKNQFWKELCKENPILKDLESMGKALIKKIEDLHEVFIFQIRPKQEMLSSFQCTIMYTTYLVLTTNFTQFANSLSKKTKKIIQQNKSELRNFAEYGLFLKVTVNFEKVVPYIYQLTIQNASSSLLNLLDIEKEQIVFKNVTFLIPKEFQVLHSEKLDAVFRDITFFQEKSIFFNSSKQLPFLNSKPHEIIFLEMTANFYYNPTMQHPLIKCLLKKVSQNRFSFICDLNGNPLYQQPDVEGFFLGEKKVIECIRQMKKNYELNGCLQAHQAVLIQKQMQYSLKCEPIFFPKLISSGQQPLIRVIIHNQNSKIEKKMMENLFLLHRIKNIEGFVDNKETDSQASNASRKDSIQNVLTLLMQSSSFQAQVYLTLTLLFILIFSVLCFLVSLNCFHLWTSISKQKNPIFTALNFITVRTTLNSVLGWQYDLLYFEANKNSKSLLELQRKFYNSTSILKQLYELRQIQLKQSFIFLQKVVYHYLLGFQNEISDLIQKQFEKELVVKNPHFNYGNKTIAPITLQSLLLNYITDIYDMIHGKSYRQTLLFFSYISQFYKMENDISEKINQLINSKIVESLRNNYITFGFANLILLSFIIPIWKFNSRNKRKHQKIYSLLASIESKLILQEIKKLQNLQNHVFKNYMYSQTERPVLNADNFQQSEKIHEKTVYPNDYNLTTVDIIYEGIKKLTAEEIANISKNQMKIKVRKRAGELFVEGSDCDQKRFILGDWVALFFLIFFLALTNAYIWQKIWNINKMNETFETGLAQVGHLEKNMIGLLNAKIFFNSYKSTHKLKFQNVDMMEWLQKWLTEYNYSTSFPIENDVKIQYCLNNTITCSQNYSENLFQGMILTSINTSFIFKRDNLLKNLPGNETQSAYLRFLLHLSQQFCRQINKNKNGLIEQSYNELEKKYKIYNSQNNIIESLFWSLAMAFCIFSVLYTIKVKKSYVKNVTLLSILNRQMLYNNKRVESFLHKLLKNQ